MQVLSKISSEGWRWIVGGLLGILSTSAIYLWSAAQTVNTLELKVSQLERDVVEIKETQKTLNQILVTVEGIRVKVDILERSVNRDERRGGN